MGLAFAGTTAAVLSSAVGDKTHIAPPREGVLLCRNRQGIERVAVH